MICSIGFAPQPPLLDPALASGAAHELDELRTACDRLVKELATSARRVLVVGDEQGIAMGTWLIARYEPTVEVVCAEIGPGFDQTGSPLELASATPEPVAVLVMGDGTACRTEKAPGYFDQRSREFDDAVVKALRTADPVALAALDQDLGEQLLAAGTPTWKVVSNWVESDPRYWAGAVTYADDPYGVAYFVAIWRPSP